MKLRNWLIGTVEMYHASSVVLVIGLCLVTGCVGAARPGRPGLASEKPTATQSPTASDSPAATQSPTASETSPSSDAPPCIDARVIAEPLPQTIAIQASISPLIFVGTYQGSGPGFWDTPGRVPPRTDEGARDASIYTSVDVVAEQVIRGEAQDVSASVIAGGVVGCSEVSWDPALTMEPDQRYLVFGTGPGQESDRGLFGSFVLYTAWPVGDDDVVETAQEGELPLDQVIETIEQYPKVPYGDPLPYPTREPAIDPPSSEGP